MRGMLPEPQGRRLKRRSPFFCLLALTERRRLVLKGYLTREVVDYRFGGLALCTLSVLLLDAVGAFQSQ